MKHNRKDCELFGACVMNQDNVENTEYDDQQERVWEI